MRFFVCCAALSVCSSLFAAPIPVAGSLSFVGGVAGTFAISFDSGPAGPTLDQVTINLAPGLFFDTTSAAPGYLTWLDLTPVSGAASTGYSGASPSSAAGLNGAASLTLNFTNFTPGKVFSFLIDVDETVTLPACSPAPLCQAAAILDGSVVNASEFAGTTATFVFNGVDIVPSSVPMTFTGGTGLAHTQNFAAAIDQVPEPSTYLMLGSGLLLLALKLPPKRSSP